MQSSSKSAVSEVLPEQLSVVCHCSNVCNRASGRGCCPCLARSRKCNVHCKCGTEKMRCKNKPRDLEDTKAVENDDEEDSTEDVPVRDRLTDSEVLSEESVTEVNGRGRKRKRKGTPNRKSIGTRSMHRYKKEWEQMPELRQWLTLGKTNRHAYCIFCDCELKVDQDGSCLLRHNLSPGHVKSAKVWKVRSLEKVQSDRAGTRTKREVLEYIPEFKPWLRLRPLTGCSYCLYCKTEIKDGETLDIFRKHRKSKKHSKMAASAVVVETSENEEDGIILSTDSEQPVSGSDDDYDEDDIDYLEAESTENHFTTEEISQQAKETEAKILTFMVENNIPLNLTESLVSMLKGLPSVEVGLKRLQMDNEKAANVVRQSNDSFLNEVLVEKLKGTLFYLLIDVRTESVSKKHVGIFVVFCSSDLVIQVELLDVKDCGEGTAENIYGSLMESLKQKEKEGLPLSNWMGFLCNTTNIPFHTMFSVMAMVAGEYPCVSPLVCPSRMAELSAITACKSLPGKLENFCHLIHTHFLSGPKQAVSYLDFHEFCNEKNHDIFSAEDMPWLAMYDFLSKLLEQWDPLRSYFTCLMMTEPDELYSVILETLLNPLMKVLLLALRFAFGVIRTHSSTLVVEEPLYADLDKESSKLIRTFANFFMKIDAVAVADDVTKLCVTDKETYLTLPQMYLGFDASGALSSHMEKNLLTFDDPDIVDVLNIVRGFYREVITHLQVSLQMSQSVCSKATFINPQNAVNVEAPVGDDVFASFGSSDLVSLKEVREEWHSVCNIALPSSEILQTPLQYWKYVLSQKRDGFKNLRSVVRYFFSLPVLRSSEEKIFKFVKHWNLKAWNSLKSADLWTYRNAQSKILRNMFPLHLQSLS